MFSNKSVVALEVEVDYAEDNVLPSRTLPPLAPLPPGVRRFLNTDIEFTKLHDDLLRREG